MMLRWLLQIDGAAFTLIGIIVLFTPSPQPTLIHPLDEHALRPFKDTRRLLATQFIGDGLLALVMGSLVHDASILRLAGAARLLTLATVIAVNVSQLRGGAWKPASLRALITTFALIGLVYIILIVAT